MKIVYLSQYFPPEMGAPAARVSELSRHWVKAGHDVTVLTGFPHYPSGIVPQEYRSKLRRLIMREDLDGIRVERTWLATLPNRKAWERIVNYTSFTISAALRGSFLDSPDVLIATSPQLLGCLAGLWIARLKGVPFVFEVRDLWPESLTVDANSALNRQVRAVLSRIANLLYRCADHIVVVTPAFKKHIVQHYGVAPERISVVTNGVEVDEFTPSAEPDSVMEEFQLRGRFVVSFIGVLGNAHGLQTVAHAAARLQESRPEVLLLLVGEGADRSNIEALSARMGLENLLIVGQQPRSKIPALIRASSACMVLLKKSEVFKTVIPTKLLEFMACGRPVILGAEGQARDLVRNADCGVCIPPEDSESLAAAIDQLFHDPDLRNRLGTNGRQYVVKHLSRAQTAKDYTTVLQRVSVSRTLVLRPPNHGCTKAAGGHVGVSLDDQK
jgi:colanic acid biosynthesis glycosyl transferase WcaI